ncbi:MAG: substrate-binding domain-containing protein [Planctomycetes bacterium]|nr:substrate-binding domain-containing protein [Planctomycetota bacterium]
MLAWAVVAATLAGSLGCGDSSKTGGGEQALKVAVIPKGTIHEYWKSIHAGAVKAEREIKGIQIVWKGPVKEDDREQQINVVENFVTGGVDGIVLAPLDEVALVKPVRDAMRAGIAVLIMDSGLRAEAGRDYVSYVATDNEAGGKLAADRMIDVLGGAGKVLVLRYQVGSASTTQREDGFLAAIKAAPGITLVSSDQYGGPTSDTAYTQSENLLNRFAELDGVFCSCEPMAFGMLRALQSAGRTGKVKLVAFDPSEKLIQAMKDGQLHGIVLQDPLNMGYLAVKTMAAHLRGEKVPTRIDTGCTIAMPENMNEPRIKELLSPPIGRYLR